MQRTLTKEQLDNLTDMVEDHITFYLINLLDMYKPLSENLVILSISSYMVMVFNHYNLNHEIKNHHQTSP